MEKNKILLWSGIILILVAIAILIIVFSEKIPTQTTDQPSTGIDEETKMKIIHREEVAIDPILRVEIIDEYISNCHKIEGSINRIDCLEEYYSEDFVVELKNECEGKQGEEYDSCMDEYYSTQNRNALDESFCEGIKNEQLKQECLDYN